MTEDFQRIENLLSAGFLAAYLLGYDDSRQENQIKIDSMSFADGDDDKLVERFGDEFFAELRFDVPPEEAIDYFRRKGILTKRVFNKLTREARAAAFTVGGIYKTDILEAIRAEILSALETGQTQRFVVDKFKKILVGAGHKMLGDYHLETVFRTNMQMAYGVGRRKAMDDVADILPFWERVAVMDDRTRPTHRAMDGITLPANHQFWDDHYPPDDFACRCSVRAVAEMPENYNAEQPNEDARIIYDDDGNPAKAEYMTQVLDLKSKTFVGVPKSASLKSALKDAAKRAKVNRSGSKLK